MRNPLYSLPSRCLVVSLSLAVAGPAFAGNTELFGSGKEVLYREERLDRQFKKTQVAKLLTSGTDNPACVQLLGGLLMVLAEAGPMFHKRDENFFIDPVLQEALATQLSTPSFNALQYFVAMVRQVMLLKRLPDEWLETATRLNSVVKIIDLGRLKQLNEGLQLADSAYFTIPSLAKAFHDDVLATNSAATEDVVATFRDTYLDRDIAWGGAVLLDAGLNRPKGKKSLRTASAGPDEIVAILEWTPPDPRQQQLDLMATKVERPKPIRIIAKLAPKQYLTVEKIKKGTRVLVKGRFYEMTRNFAELEVRDARLFIDRDLSQGVLLGTPDAISQCPAAINDLTGLAPDQPGGFAH